MRVAFDSNQYQDPAKVLEEKQARSCKGCVYKSTLWGMDVCSLRDLRKPGDTMYRCKQYKTEGKK